MTIIANGDMRRGKRAVHDAEAIRGIVERCRTLRLGLSDEHGVFVVPLSFGYDWQQAPSSGEPFALTLWVHCAGEGRKLDALSVPGARVAVEMDAELGVIEGDFSCAYSLAYESIMGTASARRALSADEKLHGLARIMEHMAPGAPVAFSADAVRGTELFALDVIELSAKRRSG